MQTAKNTFKIKPCLNCNNSFSLTPEDYEFFARFAVVEPKLCPECRQQRRLAFNNETILYKRKCDFSGQEVPSVYSADKNYKVYKASIWWSNKWDPLDYGLDFDFSKTFFEQYALLSKNTPHSSIYTNYKLDKNSESTNHAGGNINCYYVFHADRNVNCLYSYGINYSQECVDCYNLSNSSFCYECIDCHNAKNLFFSQNSINCQDSYFLEDCISCKNCIACKNLRGKEFYIFNKAYSEKEYFRFLASLNLNSRKCLDKFQGEFAEFCLDIPNRNLRLFNCKNSSGDYLLDCTNVHNSFDCSSIENSRYCYQVHNKATNCMDLYQFGLNANSIYDSSSIGYDAQSVLFSHFCSEKIQDISYSMYCFKSKNLFGCFGLKNKKFCILNKQYTKSEYENLVQKIISHLKETQEWGEFFPIKLSAFAYNETTAQIYFPLDKKQILDHGYQWKDRDSEQQNENVAPDIINESNTNAICNQHYLCESSFQIYQLTKNELDFYKKFNLPVPQKCFNQRHRERILKRNPRVIRKDKCKVCKELILTSQNKEKRNKIYCESCFEQQSSKHEKNSFLSQQISNI